MARDSCDGAKVFFSPESKYLFVAATMQATFAKPGDENWHIFPIRVFDVASGREISRFHADPKKKEAGEPITCAVCSPDKKLLALAQKGSATIRIFDVATGRLRKELTGHRHGVHDLAFSPDGQTLASGGEDNIVLVWDLRGLKE